MMSIKDQLIHLIQISEDEKFLYILLVMLHTHCLRNKT